MIEDCRQIFQLISRSVFKMRIEPIQHRPLDRLAFGRSRHVVAHARGFIKIGFHRDHHIKWQ